MEGLSAAALFIGPHNSHTAPWPLKCTPHVLS